MIKLIAAVSKNGVIGKEGDLVFSDKEDMKHFRETTTGHVVVMGASTFNSIPKAFRPLKNRENFVLTRSTDIFDPSLKGITILRDINEKVWRKLSSNLKKDIFVIGGGQIYAQAIDFVDELIISHFHEEVEGDVVFPIINPEVWKVKEVKEFTNFTLKIYNKI